jgi:tripartite-type tricarboxylate transporter receptor subunit TctC
MQSQTVTTTSKYPIKPITVIVPFSAGGGLDLTARALGNLAPKYMGQSLVVVNKTGGAGAIGYNEVAGANPDGYTVGIVSSDMLLLSIYGSGKYEYLTALEPLVQVVSVPMILVVKADQPWENLNDLTTYARQHPRQLKFGHSGIGSFPHVLGEMFAHESGIEVEQVPFSGGSESTTALLGGHVQFIFTTPTLIKEHIKNGTLRTLATTSQQRMTDPLFAPIPTLKEQGVKITLTNWFGIAVPKETSAKIKNELAEGFRAMINDPQFQSNMDNISLPVEYLGPKESQAKWIADSQTMAKALNETGVLERIKAQRK